MPESMVDTILRGRRKTLQLTVDPDGRVVARAPFWMPKGEIERFAESRADWISRRKLAATLRPRYAFIDGERFLLAGGTFVLRLDPAAGRARFFDDVLTLPAEPPERVRERLVAFYRDRAREFAKASVARYEPAVGVTAGQIRIMGAATRWGSCGKENAINLNWRLALAPPEILDYVVVHELSHILHRDHSRAFWNEVAKTVPDWKRKRDWLNEHRLELEV